MRRAVLRRAVVTVVMSCLAGAGPGVAPAVASPVAGALPAIVPASAGSPRGVARPAATVVTLDSGAHVGALRVTTALPRERISLSGSVSGPPGRLVVLQRVIGGRWVEVGRGTARPRWRIETGAPASGTARLRAVVPGTSGSAPATSVTRTIAVVTPTISTRVSRPVVAPGEVVTVTGAAVPARPGRPVQLWELRGPHWAVVAQGTQSASGGFALRLLAPAAGTHTYRTVTTAADGAYGVRARPATVTAVRSARPWSVYLGDVTPQTCLGCGEPAGSTGRPGFLVTPVVIGGHTYPRSIQTSSPLLSYDLGGVAASLSTALMLRPVAGNGTVARGPRLVEVRVDGRVRLRRQLRDGQAVRLVLDLRGARTLTIWSTDRGGFDNGIGSQLLLVTPVVSSTVLAERGADAGTVLSQLRPLSVSGGLRVGALVGSVSRNLYGGSLALPGTTSLTTGRSGAVEYDLAGRYTRLTGVPVLDGETAPGLSGSVRVYGDDRLLATLPVTYDGSGRTPSTRGVDVSGVRRLRIELVSDPQAREMAYAFSYVVAFADPRLT